MVQVTHPVAAPAFTKTLIPNPSLVLKERAADCYVLDLSNAEKHKIKLISQKCARIAGFEQEAQL